MNDDPVIHKIYKELSPPVTSEKLQTAYGMGMVKKEDLVDGATYIGICRNASEAIWNEAKQRFTYIREKWGDTFPEDIVYPSDDEGFDIFVPVALKED